jgi:hypothetical protein
LSEQIENSRTGEEYSVLFIGDSFLEAIQVENRFTIPQIIRTIFSTEFPHLDISVTNAGVGGWSPNHYYLEARRLSHRQYDLAITFLYVANDVICEKVQEFSPKEAHVHRFGPPRSFTYEEIVSAILYPLNETLESRSHLYVLIKSRTKWLRMKLGLSPYYFPDVFMTETRSSACWSTTAEVCRSIHDEFSRHGTPCFFVLLPPDYQTDERIFHSYMKSLNVDVASVDLEQPNRILQRLCKASSLLLIDPLEHMRAKTKTGVTMYGYIDSHLNAQGHRVVAEYLVPIIRPMIAEKY